MDHSGTEHIIEGQLIADRINLQDEYILGEEGRPFSFSAEGEGVISEIAIAEIKNVQTRTKMENKVINLEIEYDLLLLYSTREAAKEIYHLTTHSFCYRNSVFCKKKLLESAPLSCVCTLDSPSLSIRVLPGGRIIEILGKGNIRCRLLSPAIISPEHRMAYTEEPFLQTEPEKPCHLNNEELAEEDSEIRPRLVPLEKIKAYRNRIRKMADDFAAKVQQTEEKYLYLKQEYNKLCQQNSFLKEENHKTQQEIKILAEQLRKENEAIASLRKKLRSLTEENRQLIEQLENNTKSPSATPLSSQENRNNLFSLNTIGKLSKNFVRKVNSGRR
jgi:hypothetical protein